MISLLKAIGKFLFFAIRPISKTESAYGWYQLSNLILVGYFTPIPFNFLSGINPIIWYIGIPLLLCVIAGIKLQIKVDRYDSKEVELLFDPDKYPSCRMYEGRYCPDKVVRTATMYRIGLRVKGQKAVKARVQLKKFTPQGSNFLPQTLTPMNLPSKGKGWVTLNPSYEPNDYINVIEWTEGEEIAICFHYDADDKKCWPNLIPIDQYTFSLEVQVENAMSFDQDFLVDIVDNQLLFMPLQSSKNNK